MGKGNKARTVLQRLITYTISRVSLLGEALCMVLPQYMTLCHCLWCHMQILTKVQQVTIHSHTLECLNSDEVQLDLVHTFNSLQSGVWSQL